MRNLGAVLGAIVLAGCGDGEPRSLQEELGDTGLRPAWIWDDLGAATQRANDDRKPLLVLFRCVP